MATWTGEQRSALYAAWDRIRGILKGMPDHPPEGAVFTRVAVAAAFSTDYPSTIDELVDAGLAHRIPEYDTFQLVSSLEAKRFRDSSSDEESSPSPIRGQTVLAAHLDDDPHPPEDPPVLEDGPGTYYQLVLSEMGMVVVRDELPPEEWGKREVFGGLLAFKNVWMLTEEAPLRQPMQNRKTGENVLVEIPRLRFSKMMEGAFWPIGSIKFCAALDRSRDPLVHHLMRFRDGIMNVGGAAPSVG